MNKPLRIVVASLSLSAAGFGALVAYEDYTETAVVPVAGDVPTVGFGSTVREDGRAVQMGERITPPKAVQRSLSHIAKDESRLRACVTAPLAQAEYDLLVDHAYQYGAAATCSSTLVRLINAGQYREACEQYLRWRFVAGRDCSLPKSGCKGVLVRAQDRRDRCIAAQGEGQ